MRALARWVAAAIVALSIAVDTQLATANAALSEDRSQALVNAIESNNEAGVLAILANDPNARLSNGDTPLIVACALNQSAMVRTLLSHGADKDATSTRGWTALMTAVFYGNRGITGFLLERGVDAGVRSADGASARTIAQWKGDTDLAERLPSGPIGAGPSVAELVRAVASSDQDGVARILAAGVKPNAVDENGTPVLLIAAASEDSFALTALLRAGAPPDTVGPDGVTALMVATQQRHEAAVRLLLGAGADPLLRAGAGGPSALTIAQAIGSGSGASLLRGAIGKAPDPQQGVALLSAAVAANDSAQIETLLRLGVKPGGGLVQGKRSVPISIAAFSGFADVTDRLLAAGADANEADDAGSTPLMAAIISNHPTIAEKLLRAHADPLATNGAKISAAEMARASGWRRLGPIDLYRRADFDGALKKGDVAAAKLLLETRDHNDWISGLDERTWGVLARGVETGSLDMVTLLLAHGAEVESPNPGVPSPLMIAAVSGRRDIVRLLLDHGADPLRGDGADNTAADMARQKNQKEIVAEIQAATRTAARRINSGLMALGFLDRADDSWTYHNRVALRRFYDAFAGFHPSASPLTYDATHAIRLALDRTIRICNATSNTVNIAYVPQPDASAVTQVVTGWVLIEPGQCSWLVRSAGEGLPGPIWMTAHSNASKWGGKESLCIPDGGLAMHEARVPSGPACLRGSHVEGFWRMDPSSSPNPVVLK